MKRMTKSEAIVDSIKQAIIGHQLQPGTKLREEHLSQIFGVSRTLVRPALLKLSQDGLVTLEPGKVASVSEITPREANDIFEARLMLEKQVLARLCTHATPQTITTLRAHVAKERSALKSGIQEDIVRLGSGFHLLMAKECGNSLLAEWLEEVLNRVALIFMLYRHTYAEHTACLIDEHETMVKHIEKRQLGKAIELVEPHLKIVQGSLMSDDTPAEFDALKHALIRER
ncbi:GntR family transcriptional regulator [Paraburkholderia sp. ZP32-5]|uniref:GntR family transcriptional regulator n=1 Tax=Paraburkholderia sp. ZP32-5 TaxID=2883245 RepID=UPI001F3E6470|nr:GntR family transcriptional regulator [Paraburkholderia sp. ZP32-5]